MGVIHFSGLGKSPGAVTAGLSYLMHEREASFEDGNIVEGAVIFTSSAIINGSEPAYPGTTHNKYMERRATSKNTTQKMQNSLNLLAEYLYNERENGKFYVCDLDINDFNACFEAIAKALLKFHHPGKTGKHIWGNITGGSNVLNAALMQTAYLSGLIPRLYYTFVANIRDDGKYLQPFTREVDEFDFRDIYVIKTTFDERYQVILQKLSDIDEIDKQRWISSRDLLSQLKQSDLRFKNIHHKTFIRNYLNTMLGIERKGNREDGQEDLNRLSNEGYRILSMLRSPLFKALILQNDITHEEIERLTADLKVRELDKVTF